MPLLGLILQCSPKWWPLEQLPETQEVKSSKLSNKRLLENLKKYPVTYWKICAYLHLFSPTYMPSSRPGPICMYRLLRKICDWVIFHHKKCFYFQFHGLRTPREKIALTARPKNQSQSQIFRYGGSIFCLPHRPKFSDIFDLCLHWVSVVRAENY